MAKRIVISPSEIKISRAGYDVDTAPIEGLVFYEGMSTMASVMAGEAVVGKGMIQLALPYAFSEFPYAIINSNNETNLAAGPATYYAEFQKENGMYRWIRLHNKLDQTLRITYSVCRAIP